MPCAKGKKSYTKQASDEVEKANKGFGKMVDQGNKKVNKATKKALMGTPGQSY